MLRLATPQVPRGQRLWNRRTAWNRGTEPQLVRSLHRRHPCVQAATPLSLALPAPRLHGNNSNTLCRRVAQVHRGDPGAEPRRPGHDLHFRKHQCERRDSSDEPNGARAVAGLQHPRCRVLGRRSGHDAWPHSPHELWRRARGQRWQCGERIVLDAGPTERPRRPDACAAVPCV